MNTHPVLDAAQKIIRIAEKINKCNVERAQVSAQLHGDNLYRDYMNLRNGTLDRELDEAFQEYYECFNQTTVKP